jgi:prepilin-type N-terminal cleavage/methylation domain-containing protein
MTKNEAPRAVARGFLKRNTEAALLTRPRCFALRSKATETVFPSFCSGLCWPRMYKKAFTLVETLIVVALFAVIGVSLLSSFVMGLKVWKLATSPNYSYRKAIIGLEKLSTELRQTVNYPAIGFWGTSDHCEFANIARDRIYNITYNYSSENNTFYRSALSLEESAGTESPVSPRKLIPEVKNFSFSFYGYDITTGNATFLDSWNYTKSGIPLAVKVAFVLEDGKEFEKVITIPISH